MSLHSDFVVLVAAIFRLDEYNGRSKNFRGRRSVVVDSECHVLDGDVGDRLGHAVLEVYMLKNNYTRIVLPKLSFIRPTWSRMDMVLSARNKSFCGSLMGNTSAVRFPYFGLVDDLDIIALEMNVTDGYLVERRKFEFFLPFFPRRNLSNIEQWEVFLYVDVSYPHKATVFWEPPPVDLNIPKYQLNVTCGAASDVFEFKNVFSFEVTFDIMSTEMSCRLYLRPWLPILSKWGYRSSTPPVLIKREEVLYIWILILCALLVTLAFLGYRLSRVLDLKCRHKITGSALLIYEAKTEEQLKFVFLLAQTLEEDHRIKVHLDHRDIPLTESKDPLKWFVEALPNSEFIIFLQLPAPQNGACVPPGVYSSQMMATDNVFRMFQNSSRIIVVELDSCPYEESWVCSNLKSRFKYVLPRDLKILVGKEDPFLSPLGSRLKQSISHCIQEIKDDKEGKVVDKEACISEFPISNLNQEEEKETDEEEEEGGGEEEEDSEIVVSGRRRLLELFNLGGVPSDSDSE